MCWDKVIGQVDVQIKTMKEDASEALEIDKRRNNLIVHGMKESKKDDVAVLIAHLLRVGLHIDGSKHINEESRICRLADNKVRPIRLRI